LPENEQIAFGTGVLVDGLEVLSFVSEL